MYQKDEDKKQVGRALIASAQAGRDAQENQARFRTYLNAFAVATDIVGALTRNPGFHELSSKELSENLKRMTGAIESVRKYIESRLVERGVQVKEARDHAQLNRLAANLVAQYWSVDDHENQAFVKHFQRDPKTGEGRVVEMKALKERMRLMTAYLNQVARQWANSSLADHSPPEFVQYRPLDRILAMGQVFSRLDPPIRSFAERYLGGDRPDSFCRLIAGASLNEPVTLRSPDELTEKVITQVVCPIVDERHQALLTVFDPKEIFSPKDRHIAYRALMRTVSEDAAQILSHEEWMFVDRIKRIRKEDPELVESYRQESGALIPWLRDRINVRMDRIYPRPDEYASERQGLRQKHAHRKDDTQGPSSEGSKKKDSFDASP